MPPNLGMSDGQLIEAFTNQYQLREQTYLDRMRMLGFVILPGRSIDDTGAIAPLLQFTECDRAESR